MMDVARPIRDIWRKARNAWKISENHVLKRNHLADDQTG